MKQFAGHKTLEQIKAQCKAQGVRYDDSKFRTGSDRVEIGGPVHMLNVTDKPSYFLTRSCPAWVLYNSFNGNFFGTTDRGIQFDSTSTEHKNEPWFQALLAFFYEELPGSDLDLSAHSMSAHAQRTAAVDPQDGISIAAKPI